MAHESKRELREELLNNDDDDEDGDEPQGFVALSESEREDLNQLLEDLNRSGYETVGQYSLSTEGPDAPTIATVSVVLPSTNDWDPSEAFDDGE